MTGCLQLYWMQFFALYDLHIMPAFHFPGQNFPAPAIVKMADLGYPDLLGSRKTSDERVI